MNRNVLLRQQQGLAEPQPVRRFLVWNGTAICHSSVPEVIEAVRLLVPSDGYHVVWSPKGGEGGSPQSEFDPHPIAISGPDQLRRLRDQCQQRGIDLIPYVVVRGNPEWNSAEWNQIGDYAEICGQVILNLEPEEVVNGRKYYWNGPTTPGALLSQYLVPLLQHVSRDALELCAIPSDDAVAGLGGADTMRTWLECVGACGWECYGDAVPILEPDVALKRVEKWLPANAGPEYRIPIVQRSMIGRTYDKAYAQRGMEVWCLDADLLVPDTTWPWKSQKPGEKVPEAVVPA